MPLEDADAKTPFKQAASTRETSQEVEAVRVPDMIQDEVPQLRPTPPGVGALVDAYAFDQRWRAEQRRAEPTTLDPFDRVDEKAGLENTFNRQADALGHAQARTNAADNRLAGAVEEALEYTDRGRDAPEELENRVDALWHDALREESHLEALESSAKPINQSIDLKDAFDSVDRLALERGRERDNRGR